MFYDAHTDMIYSYFHSSVIINKWNEDKNCVCSKWFTIKVLKTFEFFPILDAKDYHFINKYEMNKFFDKIRQKWCYPRIIRITDKVTSSCRLEVFHSTLLDKSQIKEIEDNNIIGINVWGWVKCRLIEEGKFDSDTSIPRICTRSLGQSMSVSLSKISELIVWNMIKKPVSYDPEFFSASETTNNSDERNCTELVRNLYMLFDYEVNQYWNKNQLKEKCKFGFSNRSILWSNAPMHIVFNASDDWQVQLSDKIKKLGLSIIMDNKEWSKWWQKNYYQIITKSWNYRDIRAMYSNEIHWKLNQQSIKEVSTGHNNDTGSLTMARILRNELSNLFDHELWEIRKLSDVPHDLDFDCSSSVRIANNSIKVFEIPHGRLFINHIDNARHLSICRELKRASKAPYLEFALKPYQDYLEMPEIYHYRHLGQLEICKGIIRIRNCSLILAFGMKRLVDDISANKLVPGFEMTNVNDYKVIQPKTVPLSWRSRDPDKKKEFEYYCKKFWTKKRSIRKLYNTTIFLKYNAIRYFYYINSYHRDIQQDNDQVIQGTDMNVIYKEQIDDGVDAQYSARHNTRNSYNIIHSTSMMNLLLDILSLDNITSIDKDVNNCKY